MGSEKTLFVWRNSIDREEKLRRITRCPCCQWEVDDYSVDYEYEFVGLQGNLIEEFKKSCPLCGWYLYHWADHQRWSADNAIVRSSRLAILKQFEIDSYEVTLRELGTYLRHNFSDVYALDWRRFESLVADVFKEHGFDAVLTQQTRDGGADILVYHKSRDNLFAVIECKRYAKERKIGVNLVRTLIGAAVDWNVQRAYLVTTSDFSPDARRLSLDYKSKGYDIDLVAASELLKMLQVYNEQLPPLNLLSADMRSRIASGNQGH